MKKAILVVGPPRSGTSLISHVVSQLGVHFGDPDRFVNPETHSHNPIFFELESLNRLNDEIFDCFSKKWGEFDWTPERADFDERLISIFEGKVAKFVEDEFGESKTIGLKDPRFCYTLPLWETILNRLGFKVVYILVRRPSDAIFVSNKLVNKLPSTVNFRLVAQSALAARYFVEGRKFIAVDYEDLIALPEMIIGQICDGLDLNNSLIDEARAVIRKDLAHHKKAPSTSLYSYFTNVIDSASLTSEEYLWFKEISFAATFDRDECIAALHQTMTERDNQIACLHNTVAERDNQIACLHNTVAERDGQIVSLNHAMEAKDIQITDLSGIVAALQNSTSWRVSKPIRIAGDQLRRVKRVLKLLPAAVNRGGGVKNTIVKATRLYQSEGIAGMKRMLTAIHKPSHESKSYPDRNDYQAWIRRYDTIDDTTRMQISERIAVMENSPVISVVMPTFNPEPKWLIEAIDSVQKQLYPNWELCIADDASTDPAIRSLLERFAQEEKRIKVMFREENGHISAASNSALEIATGDFVAFLDQDDCLSPVALYELASRILAEDNVDILYSDEDKLSADGERVYPFFKPDWSPHLAISQAFLGHLVCYRTSLVKELGGLRPEFNGAQDYDFWLRASLKARKIVHVPRVLYHWRLHETSTSMNAGAKPYAHEAGRKAVDNYLQERYGGAWIRAVDGDHTFTYAAEFDIPIEVLVSVIIPTRDRVDLLRPCVESILTQSSWKNFEILILDNGSSEAVTNEYLRRIQEEDSRVRVIPADMPFNWSCLNNLGASVARGDIFIFLNNDTQVISPKWIECLAGYARLPDVGAVGGLLLFEDGTIQHSGVVVGMGGWADHVFRAHPLSHIGGGPFVSPILTRNVLAVTGACTAITKEKFEQLGGYDESFIICGSDVELCLRAHRHGYYNVMCAEARLYHYESKTRTPHVPAEDFKQSELKYAPYRVDKIDPFYNPNLSLARTAPLLSVSSNHA